MLVDCVLTSKYKDHYKAQYDTRGRITDLGIHISCLSWRSGTGGSTHTWTVKCTPKEFTALSLACKSVSLTPQNMLLEKKEICCRDIERLQTEIDRINEQLGEL